MPLSPSIFSMIFERAGARGSVCPEYAAHGYTRAFLARTYAANSPVNPLRGWVVDGCCTGDAIGGRAVTGGRVVVGGGKALGCPWGGKRRWCNGVGGCMNRRTEREREREREREGGRGSERGGAGGGVRTEMERP